MTFVPNFRTCRNCGHSSPTKTFAIVKCNTGWGGKFFNRSDDSCTNFTLIAEPIIKKEPKTDKLPIHLL